MNAPGLRSGLGRVWAGALGWTATASAATTTAVSDPLPDVGASALRVLGTLTVLLALVLAGAWLARNARRLAARRSGQAALEVVDARPLGHRQMLYVVAYQQQRFLVGASPAGVTLLTELAPGSAPVTPTVIPPASFGQTLQQVLAMR